MVGWAALPPSTPTGTGRPARDRQGPEDRAWRNACEKLFSSSLPSASPVLLSIGAQLGAGKTGDLDASLRNFYPDQDFV